MAEARDDVAAAEAARREAEETFRRKRRSRSIALAVALAALVILFYAVTIAKMGPQILDRPL